MRKKLAILVVVLALVSLAAVILIIGRVPQLEPTGRYVTVTFNAERIVSGEANLPESEYTKRFTYDLGSSFSDLTDEGWWSRFKQELEKTAERYNQGPEQKRWVRVVPPIDWLKENVKRGVFVMHVLIIQGLPADGTLQSIVSKQEFQKYGDDDPHHDQWSPMHVVFQGYHTYSIWNFITDEWHSQKVYVNTLSDVQKGGSGLLFRFKDGKYLILEIPDEIMNLEQEDLVNGPVVISTQAEILIAK